MKKQSGFSLMELVIVIVILGLLAVAALPRFLDVTDEAKRASIEGVAGGFATAVLSARAQWEAEGRPKTNNLNVVDYDGTNFLLTDSTNNNFRDGYPISLYGGSSVTAVTAAICKSLMEELLQNPPSVDVNATTSPDYIASALSSTECQYQQQENGTSHNFVYQVSAGRVTVNLVN
ncbi:MULTISPECIES: type II secretion system protein [unclassified Vibrio]|uniref:type II secretion system protein n=1 Tax=unclassified Vibrio TaxID=2614977 RepID=UPI001493A7F1|nr:MULTISPECIES: type II secretion system protein [unclassified Vibrio]NOI65907.1 type II secretion system protein [Vibrio sp. 99-8-1]